MEIKDLKQFLKVTVLPGFDGPKYRDPAWREYQIAYWDEGFGITARHKFIRALTRPLGDDERHLIPTSYP
jgi:hypothetical protein